MIFNIESRPADSKLITADSELFADSELITDSELMAASELIAADSEFFADNVGQVAELAGDALAIAVAELEKVKWAILTI